jgi:DNA-binding NtrC family response regulator
VNVFDIHLPPLRERRDDIALLATSFLRDLGHITRRRPAELMPDAIEALLHHNWPGNVRELRNALERATIVCENGLIRAHDLSLQPATAPTADSTELGVVERRVIERVMREVNGNKSRAARQLGISRTQLYLRLHKHGLESAPYQATSGEVHRQPAL